MFIPDLLVYILGLGYVLIGAGLGTGLGWYSADLLRLERRRAWLDGATGAGAIATLYVLIALVSRGARVANDDTLGWRGVLLDHLALWAFGLVCLSVVSRYLLVARAPSSRRSRITPGA